MALGTAPLGSAAAAFNFVALGDTAYNGERDYPAYEALIDQINAREPAFSIHVGDIWGAGNCSDAHFERIDGFFARYTHPLVYTPGDNEWTDCDIAAMGGFDPNERLDHIRRLWFSEAKSLGAPAMDVVRQADVSAAHARFVENLRFERDGVLVVTAHVPGSNNNASAADRGRIDEFFERDAANSAWLADSFRRAIDGDYAAVVVALHAEMFEWEGNMFSPFAETIRQLRLGAARFGKPVLLINGDSHGFVLDRPLYEARGESGTPANANLWRLEVFGAPEIGAVEVSVDPADPTVFSFKALRP
ncbi:MAG: hypothetical protein MK142_00385 [Pseudomonadales bacterium]|nr:hypothetical protein [Pseudomonadales bacterium]